MNIKIYITADRYIYFSYDDEVLLVLVHNNVSYYESDYDLYRWQYGKSCFLNGIELVKLSNCDLYVCNICGIDTL